MRKFFNDGAKIVKQKKLMTIVVVFILLLSTTVNGESVNQLKYAKALNKIEVFKGSNNGFELNKRPTRLEGIVLLIRLLGVEKEIEDYKNSALPFSDVPEWGKGYVNYAYKNNLVNGISDTYFGASEDLSLNDYLTLVLRALGYNDNPEEGRVDFSWNNSLEFSTDVELLSEQDKVRLSKERFDRGALAEISYYALHTESKDGSKNLIDKLVDNNSISEVQYSILSSSDIQDSEYIALLEELEGNEYDTMNLDFNWINTFDERIGYVDVQHGSKNAVSVTEYGANGNDMLDDTAAIQHALEQADYVYIPTGVYMINGRIGLKPKSNQKIEMSSNAILKIIPNRHSGYSVFSVIDKENIEIAGGKIEGDRYSHLDQNQAYSNGVYISGNSQNIILRDTEVYNFIGNGIRIAASWNDVSSDILLENLHTYDNSENGIQIEGIGSNIKRITIKETISSYNHEGINLRGCRDVLVDKSSVNNNINNGMTFFRDIKNTAFNQVDIKENGNTGVFFVTTGQQEGSNNLLFRQCSFENNSQNFPSATDGIRIDSNDGTGTIENIYLMGCNFKNTQSVATQRYGVSVGSHSIIKNVVVGADCYFDGNTVAGIFGSYPQLVIGQSDATVDVTTVGAKGDGVTDDTKAIQRALDIADSVYIPDGVYMINTYYGIKPQDYQKITLGDGAVLKAIPNNLEYHNIIFVDGKTDITIEGGKIVGDRYEHQGTSGEWGFGISVVNGATGIRINNVEISNLWGDGIYVGGFPIPNNIYVNQVVSKNNRRQGMSITHGEDIFISNSEFIDTNGIAPCAGIDIEPNKDEFCNNVFIDKCVFNNNDGNGINIFGDRGEIKNISITGVIAKYNDYGIRVDKCANLNVANSIFNNNYHNGIDLVRDTFNANFNNVSCSENAEDGLHIVVTNQSKGTRNLVFKNSHFMDNGVNSPNEYDGARVGNYDGSSFLEKIAFYNCTFGSDKASTSQRYGISIGNIYNDRVILDKSCYFASNIRVGLKDPYQNSQFVD